MSRSLELAVFVCVLAAACGNGQPTRYGAREEPPPPAFDAARGVVHEYFPLTPGAHWIYVDARSEVSRREEVRVLTQARSILGVDCVAREQRDYDGGELVETTTEWFAQDVHGNVWLFGEESWLGEGGAAVLGEDSWLASAAHGPALVMPASLHAGDRFVMERPSGSEAVLIGRTDVEIELRIGAFANGVEWIEDPEGDDEDLILYVPGVGAVLKQDATRSLTLESVRLPN
jgi:hypothetical protein